MISTVTDKLNMLINHQCHLNTFALNLARKDLRILVRLLTGHVDLNWHLCIMGTRQNSVKRKMIQLYILSLNAVH